MDNGMSPGALAGLVLLSLLGLPCLHAIRKREESEGKSVGPTGAVERIQTVTRQ